MTVKFLSLPVTRASLTGDRQHRPTAEREEQGLIPCPRGSEHQLKRVLRCVFRVPPASVGVESVCETALLGSPTLV